MAQFFVDKDFGGENKSIREPVVGSGTMLRSAAQRLRDLQLSPHDYTWYGNDIAPLSAACAAVSTIIWDLGPRALIGCANSSPAKTAGHIWSATAPRHIPRQRSRRSPCSPSSHGANKTSSPPVSPSARHSSLTRTTSWPPASTSQPSTAKTPENYSPSHDKPEPNASCGL